MRKLFYLFTAISILVISCGKRDNQDFKTADNGLQYQFHQKHDNTDAPQRGDVVILSMRYEDEDGNVLFDTKDMDRTYMQTIKAPSHPGGSFEDALSMMHVEDSASFKINAHDFLKFSMKQDNIPDKLDPESDILVHVKLKNILSKDNYGEQISKNLHVSEKKEMELLDNYLEITNTQASPDSTGLYVITLKEGNGEYPEPGDRLTVHYTGTFISGKPFDTSLGKEPIQFTLGKEEVIEGWDRGLQKVREGGKARLIIPSKLAYGKEGKGEILPYSTLIFEIELIDVQ
jgi:FKBP-type peptidyl-prolyl cis-trans isomerase